MRSTLLSLFLCACGASPPTDDTPPFELGPLPAPRHGHRAHVVDGELFVIGGFSRGGDDRGTRETWIQDLVTGAWRRGGDLNEGKAFFASVVDGDTIYAVGGSVERYDREADRWELVLADGELPRSHFGAALVGRRIIAVGGYPLELSGVKAFDLDTGTASDLAPPPGFVPGDHFHFVTELAGELHVIGGLKVEEFVPTAEHWVLEGDRWRAAAEAPEGLWAKFAIHGTLGPRFFAFCGLGDRRDDALGPPTGLCYDARSDRWTRVASAPVVITMPATVALDDELHVIGGSPIGESPRPTHAIVYDAKRDRWE